MRIMDGLVAAAAATTATAAYLALGWGIDTTYDHYGRLAAALVAGRWWLVEHPPWLVDLVACGPGRWCVGDPPLPAVLATAFLPLGPAALAQSLMARVAGGASMGFLYLGLRAYGAPRLVALAGAAVSALGTTLLFTSVDARSAYAAHSVAMLFGSAAFALAARGGPTWAIGVATGLAALARPPFAVATPALALLAARRSGAPYLAVLWRVVLAVIPFALAYAAYDLARWGSVLDVGSARLAEGDVFFSHGLVSPLYVPRHLSAIFLEPPDLVEGVPWFLRPRFVGMSLFITTPAFLWVFAGLRAVRRSAAVAGTGIAAGLALAPDVLSGAIGAPQFGYRLSIDAQPFLVALAVTGDAVAGGVWRRRPSWLFLLAAALAVAVNVYATIAIVRYGYWQ